MIHVTILFNHKYTLKMVYIAKLVISYAKGCLVSYTCTIWLKALKKSLIDRLVTKSPHIPNAWTPKPSICVQTYRIIVDKVIRLDEVTEISAWVWNWNITVSLSSGLSPTAAHDCCSVLEEQLRRSRRLMIDGLSHRELERDGVATVWFSR